jgi:hypothetical protein
MLSFPSAQVKSRFVISGLTRDYTVKHTMASKCIPTEAWAERSWMILLRDGEWSVWCSHCPWRSRPAVTLAIALASRHICGGSGTASEDGRAAALLQAS